MANGTEKITTNFMRALRGSRKRTPGEAAADFGMTPDEVKQTNLRYRRTGRGRVIQPKLLKGRGEY